MRRPLGAALLLLVAAAPSALEVPPLTGRVVDLADVLSGATESALGVALAAHEDSTSNQIVVLTIPSLEGEILEPYATRVFREWSLGREDADNGVLVLVAVQDRKVRIEVGYGLEGDLTDAASGSIIRHEIVPRFKEGDFDAGVLDGVSAILEAVDGTYSPPEPQPAPDWLIPAVLSIPLALFALIGTVRDLYNGPEDIAAQQGCGATVLTGVIAYAGVSMGLIEDGTLAEWWPWVLGAIGALIAFSVFRVALNRWAEGHPYWGPKRHHNRAKRVAFGRARARGDKTVVVDGRSYSVPIVSSSSGGSSGGGGFSGGGGSSGGGGASGSW